MTTLRQTDRHAHNLKRPSLYAQLHAPDMSRRSVMSSARCAAARATPGSWDEFSRGLGAETSLRLDLAPVYTRRTADQAPTVDQYSRFNRFAKNARIAINTAQGAFHQEPVRILTCTDSG